MSLSTPAREYAPGIGQAVADRTISRKLDPVTRKELSAWTKAGPDSRPYTRETWQEVAYRVSLGNASLAGDQDFEFTKLHHHMRQASVLMSGRHLQHTDVNIGTRNQEVLTNCSTAAMSAVEFYLLLNGSGVGRSYDDDMMLVDWCKNMPNVICTIDSEHPDVISGEIKDYLSNVAPDIDNHYLAVADSREGWVKAIEKIEHMTYAGVYGDSTLILDFSGVRCKGSPIGGMQNRPASGPGPLINAINNVASLRGQSMSPWEATMHVDHYFAECVLVGGARRAARMATKTWRDKNVLDFVTVKRGGKLWSSNNSVTVDEDFWRFVRGEALPSDFDSKDEWLIEHASKVFWAICFASYYDRTGEPGLINVDMLTQNTVGVEEILTGDFVQSKRMVLDEESKRLLAMVARVATGKRFAMIVNPCGEIPLSMWGGYCVIADVVPLHAGTIDKGGPSSVYVKDWDDDAEDAFRTATRALLRVNTMDCLYRKEVERTNRIGVGFTGIHEYAWERFGYGWKDLIDEEKSLPFWKTMARFSNAIVDEAATYSAKLGQKMPHTVTTVKPAGTTSKLFDLTEGAHLPSMREYLRWVQFRNDDPLVEDYARKGYPIQRLKTYSGTTIVGFPTTPQIVSMGMGDKLVAAAEATPEEQYQWLKLLEKYWLHGHTDGVEHPYGGQVSYTLKYDPEQVSFEEFQLSLLHGQSAVKCCSVMPQKDVTAYEYQPEQPVSRDEYAAIVANITEHTAKEDVGFEHLDCAGGACPIDFIGSDR